MWSGPGSAAVVETNMALACKGAGCNLYRSYCYIFLDESYSETLSEADTGGYYTLAKTGANQTGGRLDP